MTQLGSDLQLWQAVLRHTPAVTLDLVNLFPHLEAVMEKSFDHLPVRMPEISGWF